MTGQMCFALGCIVKGQSTLAEGRQQGRGVKVAQRFFT